MRKAQISSFCACSRLPCNKNTFFLYFFNQLRSLHGLNEYCAFSRLIAFKNFCVLVFRNVLKHFQAFHAFKLINRKFSGFKICIFCIKGGGQNIIKIVETKNYKLQPQCKYKGLNSYSLFILSVLRTSYVTTTSGIIFFI